MKYRKKPIVIEAFQTDKEVTIETLEGKMKANIGDYIITGVNGEKYPCKPDIFEKTYEKANGRLELTTAEKLLWLVNNGFFVIPPTKEDDGEYGNVFVYGKQEWHFQYGTNKKYKTLTEAINAAYEWAKE